MKENWKIYCLMSSIIYIEEMSKPTEHIQIKKYKNKEYNCLCFHPLRLKMNDPEFVRTFFKITRNWEKKKKVQLLGRTQKEPTKESWSGQDQIFFSPMWINYILSETGKIPNKYSFETAIKRIEHLKQYKSIKINSQKNELNNLLKDKRLAAGALIVSMDLEFRGIQSGRPSLCMSEKYKDFLEFMLKVVQRWNWTNNEKLSPVSMKNSLKRGINASPQYEFRININGLKEIYKLAGPLVNSNKEKCINFHVNRSENYVNLGWKNKFNNSKEKILKYLKENPNSSTTKMQFITNTGVDVVLGHLKDLEKQEKIVKQRNGKRYIWRIKCL
jgi:hypothetical protein